jgi:hypothetical protein
MVHPPYQHRFSKGRIVPNFDGSSAYSLYIKHPTAHIVNTAYPVCNEGKPVMWRVRAELFWHLNLSVGNRCPGPGASELSGTSCVEAK